jgi:hypothetical protein
MRIILLGLTLLCACSSGSDLLAPSGPSGPNVFPHPVDQGSDLPVMSKLAPSHTTRPAIVRARR